MATEIFLTALLLIAYAAIRAPYRNLPLHIDAGFYVSNHTVLTRRFRYSKGWNANYAGCSKVLPELAYSMAYLLATRENRPGTCYAPVSRWFATLFGAFSVLSTALFACTFNGNSELQYLTAAIMRAALLAEPQYGSYFECAEWFEIPFQVLSVMSIGLGLQSGEPWLAGLGAAIWTAESCFVKLSSVAGLFVLMLWLFAQPTAYWMAGLTGVASVGIVFLGWCRLNEKSFREFVFPLRGHEATFNRLRGFAVLTHRLFEKATCAWNAVRIQPLIPILALLGAFTMQGSFGFMVVYFAAVLATYLVQSADCRYYLIPFLPIAALSARGGALWLTQNGIVGWSMLIMMTAAWLFMGPIRAARSNRRELNRLCWRGPHMAHHAERNEIVEVFAGEIAKDTCGQSLLVYGPYNQAYVLLSASYDYSAVSPESYLDDMNPGWQRVLNAKLIANPPRFVLDASSVFDAHAARLRLGLNYVMIRSADSGLRLFKLESTCSPPDGWEEAQTYAPQSRAQLQVEQFRMSSLSSMDLHSRSFTAAETAPSATKLTLLLKSLKQRGFRRVALYGAGRFTVRHADIYRESTLDVALVIDDLPERFEGRFLDWPIQHPDNVSPDEMDAIIVSTDRYGKLIQQRIENRWKGAIPAFRVDETPADGDCSSFAIPAASGA